MVKSKFGQACLGHLFSFYKYATFILPSLRRMAYVKDPWADSDGWRSKACSLCREFFEKLYREKVECVHPSPSGCYCTVCFRRSMTLKGAASDVAFRYLLNLEAFIMDSRVPVDRFKYAATCGQVLEDQLFSCALPYYILVNYLTCYDEGLRYHLKCLSHSPLPLIHSDWLQMIVYDKTWLIAQLLNEKKLYWCAICEMLLFNIKTKPFAGCV